MSTVRALKYELNTTGNAYFVSTNTWNVAIATSGTIDLEARSNGDIVIPGRIVLQAANGTLYAVTVNNTGHLITTVTS